MESLNELKNEIQKLIYTKELPVEVELLVKTAQREIEKMYDDNHILDLNMKNYIEGQFAEIIPNLKTIKEQKDQKDFENIYSIISNLKLKIEEVSENAKVFDDEEPTNEASLLNRNKEIIKNSNISEGAVNATNSIVSLLNDVIEDIRNMGNRRELIVDSDLYEKFNYGINQIKNYIKSNSGQELFEVFNEENRGVLNRVANLFEKYYNIEKNTNELEKMRDSFKADLNAGISLEQQSENAKIFMEKQNEKDSNKEVKALPDNLIE